MKIKSDERVPPRIPLLMSGGITRIGGFGIWHVLGLAMFLRILLPVLAYSYTRDLTISHTPDTEYYVVPARELITHHRFFSIGSENLPTLPSLISGTAALPERSPEILRTPGFPLLLIPGLLLGRLELVTILLQILLSVLTVYMVYRTAKLLFDPEKIAIVAATLYAIEPVSILYASKLVTETVFTALVMVWLYFLLKYLKGYLLGNLLISGLALTASVYVRPVAYFVPLILAVGLSALALADSRHNARRLLSHVALFLIVSMGPILVWQERNWKLTGYSGFSGIGDEEIYFYWAASVLAVRQHMPYLEMQHRLGFRDERVYLEHHPEQKTWQPGQRLNYMKHEATRILLSYPRTFVRMHLKGTVRVMFDPCATEFLKLLNVYPREGGAGLIAQLMDKDPLTAMSAAMRERPLLFWSNVSLVPFELLYLFSACMIFFSRRLMREPAVVAAILTIIYYLGISGGPFPGAFCRFRHPAMPVISVLAGYGLYSARQRLIRATAFTSLPSQTKI